MRGKLTGNAENFHMSLREAIINIARIANAVPVTLYSRVTVNVQNVVRI